MPTPKELIACAESLPTSDGPHILREPGIEPIFRRLPKQAHPAKIVTTFYGPLVDACRSSSARHDRRAPGIWQMVSELSRRLNAIEGILPNAIECCGYTNHRQKQATSYTPQTAFMPTTLHPALLNARSLVCRITGHALETVGEKGLKRHAVRNQVLECAYSISVHNVITNVMHACAQNRRVPRAPWHDARQSIRYIVMLTRDFPSSSSSPALMPFQSSGRCSAENQTCRAVPLQVTSQTCNVQPSERVSGVAVNSRDGVPPASRKPPLLTRAARSCWATNFETVSGMELPLQRQNYTLQHDSVSRPSIPRRLVATG